MSQWLCSACSSYINHLFSPSNYLPQDNAHNHHLAYNRKNLNSIATWISSSSSCELCQFILIGFKKKYFSYLGSLDSSQILEFLTNNFEPGSLKVHTYGKEDRFKPGPNDEGELDPRLGIYCISIETPLSLDHFLEGQNGFEVCFSLWVDDEHPAHISGDVARKELLQDTGTQDSFDQIQLWLDDCVKNHTQCETMISGEQLDELQGPVLPTRILDLGGPIQSIKLVEGAHIRSHYAALSHCWGPPDKRPLATTKKTLQDHFEGIPFSNLPQTFKDAIITARQVGLQYLWIDSLCIIQDDEDDWLREAESMGLIYAKARVTIAAADATDSSKGCFAKDRIAPNVRIQLPYISPSSDNKNSVFTLSLGVLSPNNRTMTMLPLRQRAWVVQERILARRTITYGNGDIFWNCRELENLIVGRQGPPFLAGPDGDHWISVLISYCNCRLTRYTDTLIALQGLANEMKKALDANYHFGVWTDMLPGLLLWARTDSMRRNADMEGRVPSWSWAAMIGPRDFWYRPSTKDVRYLTEGIEIKGQRLNISGPLKKGYSCQKKHAISTSEHQGKPAIAWYCSDLFHLEMSVEDCDEAHCGYAAFDLGYSREFYCLFVAKGCPFGVASEGFSYTVLLLEPIELDALVFRRIGLGAVVKQEHIGTAKHSSLTIM